MLFATAHVSGPATNNATRSLAGAGPWRMRRYRRSVDATLTILPFETAFFARFDVHAFDGDRRRHDRHLARHRLQCSKAEALLRRRQQERVGDREQRAHVDTPRAQKLDRRLESAASRS